MLSTAVVTAAGASGAGSVTVSSGAHYPAGVVAGRGRMPMFSSKTHLAGAVAAVGRITSYTGTGISGPQGITVGPGGALWFIGTLQISAGNFWPGGTAFTTHFVHS